VTAEASLPAVTFLEAIGEAPGSSPPQNEHLVRLVALSQELDGSYFELVKGDTNYLTDLGLRRLEEARQYFEAQILDSVDPQTVAEVLRALPVIDACLASLGRRVGLDLEVADLPCIRVEDAPPIVTAAILDFYVNKLGSWDDGLRIASAIAGSEHAYSTSQDGRYLLLLVANVLATHANPRCRELYGLLRDLSGPGYERFFFQFRLAAAEIKRLRDATRAAEALAHARDLIDEFENAGLNAQDQAFCRALVCNLEALACVRQHDAARAEDLMLMAVQLLDSAPEDQIALDPNMANRYRVQIHENRALLAAVQKDWTLATLRMRIALHTAQRQHPYSLDESLSHMGYYLIQTNQFAEALQHLAAAERLLATKQVPLRTREVRKMICLIAARTGDRSLLARYAKQVA
jgi:hypothetical protein